MNNQVKLGIGGLLIAATSCSDSEGSAENLGVAQAALDVPTVQTGAATKIGQSSARLAVTTTSNGSSPVTECGVCWGGTDSSPSFVEQTTNGVRCMRQIPCINAAYFTSDGYMAQRAYVPGTTYLYRAYATNAHGIAYGGIASFSVPKVNTGAATDITTTRSRLGVTVDNMASGAVTECGVCWGPSGSVPSFVEQTTNGVRCMRQIPCINAAYFTSDGYMAQRSYVVGTSYDYRGYAINDAGVAYGETKSFKSGQCFAYTAQCWLGGNVPIFQISAARACGASLEEVASRAIGSSCSLGPGCQAPPGCCCNVSGHPVYEP